MNQDLTKGGTFVIFYVELNSWNSKLIRLIGFQEKSAIPRRKKLNSKILEFPKCVRIVAIMEAFYRDKTVGEKFM